jgi:hypothetical protein
MRNVLLHKSEIGGNPRRRSDLSTVTGVTTILANLGTHQGGNKDTVQAQVEH